MAKVLLTSVIEKSVKGGRIYLYRQIDIQILHLDINKKEPDFSVDGNNIRYGLVTIKEIGH